MSGAYLQASNLLHGSLVGVLGLGRRRGGLEEDIIDSAFLLLHLA